MRWLRPAAFAAVVCAASVVSAEPGIYKCTDDEGRTRYTSDPSHCPNAEKQVLKKQVQKVIEGEGRRRERVAPAARRASRNGSSDGLQSMWQGKRPAAERELEDVDRRLERMKQVIKACNRGGEWYKTDDAGIRQHISCEELRARDAELQSRRSELVEYLADGLEDECRRAGCQPGWVR